ncbi:MAG: biotin transporter BioY [Lachnospiraceae bacterium]|nr:biotin transporter BioY [Lachnospiraceae bacterium]
MRRKFTTKELVMCGLFTALVACGAFIQVPVPGMDYFTLQFLFVLMAGLLLGSRDGAISVGVYVLLGLVGLPIFAAGGGITYIFRPSFGYLLGFVVAAFVTGKLAEIFKKNKFLWYLLAAFGGFAVTYGIGLVYKYLMLNFYVGDKTAFVLVIMDCFPLDMPGDVVLCVLSSLLAVRLVPVMKKLMADENVRMTKI